ncbi:MAG: Gfo/Idh/MocA family oxidoreductase [Pirellulaceae bacterium]
MKTLRTAVIGAGHLGQVHARLLTAVDGVRLVAVADPSPAARQAAEALGIEACDDYRRLIGRIDAAIVAAPTVLHKEIALQLLAGGVHLLVEKPLAPTAADADEMIAAARSGGAVLQVGHVERFNPALTAVEPYIHHPRYIEAVRAFGHSFRSVDIGVVLDLMIHDIELTLSLVRDEVVDVQASGVTVLGPHEDFAEARLTFAGGCVASLKASRISDVAQRRMSIVCDDLHARLDFAAPSAHLLHAASEQLPEAFDMTTLSADERRRWKQSLFADLLPVEELAVEPTNAILEEQQDFVTSIQSKTPPRVSGVQARDALAVADRVLAAIAARRDRATTADSPRTLPLPSPLRPHRKAG